MSFEDDAAAQVYAQAQNTYYVKVLFGGMAICGIKVLPSKFEGLYVGWPGYRKEGKWKSYVEFSKNSPVKQVLEEKCLEAVEGITNSTSS